MFCIVSSVPTQVKPDTDGMAVRQLMTLVTVFILMIYLGL